MARIKGPGIFLAQFLRDEPPYDTLESIGGWVKDLGYVPPTWPSTTFAGSATSVTRNRKMLGLD